MLTKSMGRRQALLWGGTFLVSWAVVPNREVVAATLNGPYILPPLPYAYNALEPYIDAETMQFHHDKHHAAYVTNLNTALRKYPQWTGLSIEELLQKLPNLPSDIRQTVRNNGGGHANHSLFWESMGPAAGGEPTGALAAAIQTSFGSFSEFQSQFNAAGLKQFGSGWVWLGLAQDGTLQILTTANQDSPISQGMVPLLGNDVWEHAYYLSYRNRRDQYLQAWWNVVNWPVVTARYETAKST